MQVLGRIKRSVANSRDDVFLREDFSRFGSQAQVGRALDELKREGRIVRLGVGIYAKAKPSTFSGKPIPRAPLEVLAPKVLGKLGVKVQPSRQAEDYNSGRSTQVPTGMIFNVGKNKISRKIGFNGKTIGYEYA
ncbi:DUF6088 family protein [Xanthomonas dyei]|uniref:DUF6088 family protein n=1 Tax=Xanthomonas dyei TaxID=743699 RepID=UPI0032E894AA